MHINYPTYSINEFTEGYEVTDSKVAITIPRLHFMTNNNLLEAGVEHLASIFAGRCTRREYLFFTEEHYNKALSMSKHYKEMHCVLIYNLNSMNFLNAGFISEKINIQADLVNWIEIFISGTVEKTNYSKTEINNIPLTRREIQLLTFLCREVPLDAIAQHFEIQSKSVYNIRRLLLKKLNCRTTMDFFRLKTAESFKSFVASVCVNG